MESYIRNAVPDVGKKYPFCKLLLAQIKENVSGGMEERIMVNLQCVFCFQTKLPIN